MNADFDVIVVGSGPAGVSSAFPLVESGLRVLMIDGGKLPEVQPPEEDFLSARAHDENQWKWIVGKNFHALKMPDSASPKLRVPSQAYAFDDFARGNKITGDQFIAIGSLAKGGLSNAWGCGVAQLSADELAELPFPSSEMRASYARVSQRIGVSGLNDDMSDCFGTDEFLQAPIQMDKLHSRMLHLYKKRREKLHATGFMLGHSRLAALSVNMSNRKGCNLSGNCLFGCSRGALYSAAHDLPSLRKNENFTEISDFIVDELKHFKGVWTVRGKSFGGGKFRSFSAGRVVLAAGTLASTRLVLDALKYRQSMPLLSTPTAAFLLWLPSFLGAERSPGFGLGQLSFTLSLRNNISAFGSTFSTTGVLMSSFARHIPMSRRYGVDLLKGLLSSCVVGNLFLPGQLTNSRVRLKEDGSLVVSGSYSNRVAPLMDEARQKLTKAYRSIGGILLPGSFTVGPPGGDIHYAGTLPMRETPVLGETSSLGEVEGMDGVYVVDGACLPALAAKSHTLTIMANADRIGRAISMNLFRRFE